MGQIKLPKKSIEFFEKNYPEIFDTGNLAEGIWNEKVSSWYQNSSGKVVTTSPWKLLEFWNWTKKFNSDDYEF